MKKFLALAIALTFAGGANAADSLAVPASVKGATIKYVLFFTNPSNPFSGKRTLVAVSGDKVVVPTDAKYKGYCLSDAQKKVLHCGKL